MYADTKTVKEKIIRDTAKYNLAHYSSQFLGFFTAIAMRNFLGPYLMGVWSLLRVAMDYTTFANLGVEAAAAYQIPFLKGKKDSKGEEETRDCAFGFLFWTSLLCSLIILISAFILRHKFSADVLSGLVIISIYIVLQRISAYYTAVLRANANFDVINRLILFDAIVNLVLTFLLVKYFKIYGLYITVILMAFLNTSFMHLLARYRIRLSFNLKRVVLLVKVGFPLLILGVITTILGSIDKIIIAKMLGVAFVGYYSVANMAQNYLYGATNNFSIVAMPKLLEAYGKEENVEHIKKFVTVSAELVSYLLPPLLGGVFFIAPLFIKGILPQYIPGIIALQILLLDIFFRSCSPQASHFLVALGKQTWMLPINVIAILISASFSYILIKNGMGIAGAAIGTALSSLFAAIFTLAYAMRHFAKTKEIGIFILRIMFPIIYISVVVLMCHHFVNIENQYAKLIINLVVLSAASMPLLIYINRKTHILRLIFNIFKK